MSLNRKYGTFAKAECSQQCCRRRRWKRNSVFVELAHGTAQRVDNPGSTRLVQVCHVAHHRLKLPVVIEAKRHQQLGVHTKVVRPSWAAKHRCKRIAEPLHGGPWQPVAPLDVVISDRIQCTMGPEHTLLPQTSSGVALLLEH